MKSLKAKYEKPLGIVYLVQLDAGLAAGSNITVTFGSDVDGQPLIEDPTIETKYNDLYF